MECAKGSEPVWRGRVRFLLCLALLFFLPWLAFIADLPADGEDARVLMVLIIFLSAGSLLVLLLYSLSRLLIKASRWGPLAKSFAAALLFLVIVFFTGGTLMSISAVVAGRPLFAFVVLVYGGSSVWLIKQLFSVVRSIRQIG